MHPLDGGGGGVGKKSFEGALQASLMQSKCLPHLKP